MKGGETGATDEGLRFPELRTSNFILRLMHDVILSPILRVAPVSLVPRHGLWPSSSTAHASHSTRKNKMSRFSLAREPRLQCRELRTFLFEEFSLRLKPVIKGTLADTLFVDLAGSRRDPRVEIF